MYESGGKRSDRYNQNPTMNRKFGWNYPPGAANDSNAPYNQPGPVDCPDCDGYIGDHDTVGDPEEGSCYECGAEWHDDERNLCPECGSDDVGGLPCPSEGMTLADYEEDRRADAADARFDAMRER